MQSMLTHFVLLLAPSPEPDLLIDGRRGNAEPPGSSDLTVEAVGDEASWTTLPQDRGLCGEEGDPRRLLPGLEEGDRWGGRPGLPGLDEMVIGGAYPEGLKHIRETAVRTRGSAICLIYFN
jgi:hypothetical protein